MDDNDRSEWVDDDSNPFEEDDEPIGSCDNCDTNLYADDVYYVRGLRLCGQCCWHATH